MKWIDCSRNNIPTICYTLGAHASAAMQCIACIEDGKLIAGVIFDQYNKTSIHQHIWIAAGKKPSRQWFYAIFDYPFNQLGVKKTIGQIPEDNIKSRRLSEHFGFTIEAKIDDFSPTGSLLLYTLTKDACRILNSERWGTAGKTLLQEAA